MSPLALTITAPFWPRDEKTSLVPAYLFDFKVEHLGAVRWQRPETPVTRQGKLRFALRLPGCAPTVRAGNVVHAYPVKAADAAHTGEGGADREYRDERRKT